MGIVYQAYDSLLGHAVAMKYLLWRPNRSAALTAFKQEFHTLAQLQHPNICGVHDFGHDPECDCYYFTSELIRGADFYRATAGLSPEDIQIFFLQALRALDYLHAHHIAHFDIKPQNLLITTDAHGHIDPRVSNVKLIDFGLSSVIQKNALVGTPSYMAPEMIMRDQPDHRADLYSLGVLLYYALTRTNPFRGAHREETFTRQRQLLPPPLAERAVGIPARFATVIHQLLEKRREQRPADPATAIALLTGDAISTTSCDASLHSKPAWQGHDAMLTQLTAAITAPTRPDAPFVVLLAGATGSGKSHALREIKIRAQLAGVQTVSLDHTDLAARMTWVATLDTVQGEIGTPQLIVIDDAEQRLTPEVTNDLLPVCRAIRDYRAAQGDAPSRTLLLLGHHEAWSGADYCDTALELAPHEFQTLTLPPYVPPAGTAPVAPLPPLALAAPATAVAREIVVACLLTADGLTGADLFELLAPALPPTMLPALVQAGWLERDPLQLQYRATRAAAIEHRARLTDRARADWHGTLAHFFRRHPHGTMEIYLTHLRESRPEPPLAAALWECAHLAYRHGHTTRALQLLQHVMTQIAPDVQSGLWLELQCLQLRWIQERAQQTHWHDLARDLLQTLAAAQLTTPYVWKLWEQLGHFWLAAGDVPTARTCYTTALEQLGADPEQALWQLHLQQQVAACWMMSGDVAHAIALYAELDTSLAALPEALQQKIPANRHAEALFRQGDLAGAQQLAARQAAQGMAWQQPDRSLHAHHLLGKIYAQRGDRDAARQSWRQCLALAEQRGTITLVVESLLALAELVDGPTARLDAEELILLAYLKVHELPDVHLRARVALARARTAPHGTSLDHDYFVHEAMTYARQLPPHATARAELLTICESLLRTGN